MKKAIALALCFVLLISSSTGAFATAETDKKTCGTISVDFSKLEQGIILVSLENAVEYRRYKLVVEKEGAVYYYDEEENENPELKNARSEMVFVYFYDLYPGQKDAIIPLQMGNGAYRITLAEQIDGQYEPADRVYANLNIDPMIVWLQPNIKVNYSSAAVKADLKRELKWVVLPGATDKKKLESLANHMEHQFAYDFIAADKREAPEYTDVGDMIKHRIGLCEALSATTVAFLRLMGIPARLVIGRVGGGAHAWVEVYINGEFVIYDPSYREYKQHLPSYHPERYY